MCLVIDGFLLISVNFLLPPAFCLITQKSQYRNRIVNDDTVIIERFKGGSA